MTIDRARIIRGIRMPVLVIHGTDDDTVPIADSRSLLPLLPPGSRLLEIEKGDHVLKAHMDEIIPVTVEWLREHLRPSAQ